jgi:hypothetical protein
MQDEVRGHDYDGEVRIVRFRRAGRSRGSLRSREELLEITLVNYLWPALTVLFSLRLLKRDGIPALPAGGWFDCHSISYKVMNRSCRTLGSSFPYSDLSTMTISLGNPLMFVATTFM